MATIKKIWLRNYNLMPVTDFTRSIKTLISFGDD